VDGGAFAQAFLYPAAITRERRQRMKRGQHVVSGVAYVIRNRRLDPEWAVTQGRTLGIAGRAIAAMIAASGYNDVLRMWHTTVHDGIDFNLAYIGSDFTVTLPEPFDQGYMRAVRLWLPARPRRLRMVEGAAALERDRFRLKAI
jgi:hypothetical protein